MEPVTAEQCKQVVREAALTYLPHHRCGGCNVMVGYEFRRDLNAHPSWVRELGMDGPNDVVPFFDPSCGCSSDNPRPTSWEEFARNFNIQTPEHRADMWERFKTGRATHEI